jgi:ketosteroid isomerase-like protein
MSLLVHAASAQPGATNVEREIDAIRKAGQAYVEALNRGDLQALLSAWLPSGDIVDALGNRKLAVDLLKSEFATNQPRQAAPEQRITIDPNTTIRLITENVAIEDGVIEVPAPGGQSTPTGRFTAVWVKPKQTWILAGLRESAMIPQPTVRPIDQLDWMIGDWVGQSGDLEYVFSSRWDAGGHFILRDLQVRRGGSTLMRASQRVGWDPVKKHLRSWSFDSEGGYGEGAWVNDGDKWHVKTEGATADGHELNSLSTFTLNPDGTITWQVEGTAYRGEAGPTLTVTLKRPASSTPSSN